MYRRIVRRRVAEGFEYLSKGDYARVVARLAPDVHHVFEGEHALGGERHSRQATAAWFERLSRLCPRLDFTVHRVVSNGPPWNIWAAAEWSAVVQTAAGEPYRNKGTHVINIRAGKVRYLHAYEDSQVVANACAEMARLGVAEAAAAPIVD